MKKKQKKQKKILDKYDPIIYPRILYVCKNCTLKDLQDRFTTRSGTEISDKWDPSSETFTFYAIDKKTKDRVILVCIGYKSDSMADYICDICHEAEHVKQSIFEDIGLPTTVDSQEADAYLVGWAAKCIYTTFIKK